MTGPKLIKAVNATFLTTLGRLQKAPEWEKSYFLKLGIYILYKEYILQFKMSQNLNPVDGLTKVTDIFAAAYAEIVGTKDKVFNSGSPLQLVCVLTLATARPDYIFWSVDNMISTVT